MVVYTNVIEKQTRNNPNALCPLPILCLGPKLMAYLIVGQKNRIYGYFILWAIPMSYDDCNANPNESAHMQTDIYSSARMNELLVATCNIPVFKKILQYLIMCLWTMHIHMI